MLNVGHAVLHLTLRVQHERAYLRQRTVPCLACLRKAKHMRKYWRIISVYSIIHFLVDFACAFLMFRRISQSQDWYVCVLLYNFCAFAMQLPIGVVADRLNRNYLVAAAGCVLVAAGYGLAWAPVAAAIVIGLGNGLFHIGGGVDVLNISMNTAPKSGSNIAPLGVFVSPGAFGVYFGTLLGRGDAPAGIPNLIVLLSAAAIVIAAAIIIAAARRAWPGSYIQNAVFSPEARRSALIAAACLFIVVCLRSYAGLAINFPWKSAGYWGLALVCATVFGKAAGGFLSDRFGTMRTATVSLGIAAALFLLPQYPASGIAAVLLFNMSMPITLWGVAELFPGAKGFSFGLLTFALFLGFLPIHLGAGRPPFWFFTPLAAASLILLCAGLRKAKGSLIK